MVKSPNVSNNYMLFFAVSQIFVTIPQKISLKIFGITSPCRRNHRTHPVLGADMRGGMGRPNDAPAAPIVDIHDGLAVSEGLVWLGEVKAKVIIERLQGIGAADNDNR